MYQGDRPDLTDKMNLVAQRQRRTLGTLATDVVARSAYAAPGDLVTGHGSNEPQAVPVGAEGMVLTAAPSERGGVRWVTPESGGGSGEVDSDANGNVWEGPGTHPGSQVNSVFVAWHPSAAPGGRGDGAVGIGYEVTAWAGSVAIGQSAVALNLGSSDAGSVAIGDHACINGGGGVVIGALADACGSTTKSNVVVIGASALSDAESTVVIGAGAHAVGPGDVAIGRDSLGNGASTSGVSNEIVLGTSIHHTRIPGIPAFVAGDKYLVVDSSGNIHKSALGPAS